MITIEKRQNVKHDQNKPRAVLGYSLLQREKLNIQRFKNCHDLTVLTITDCRVQTVIGGVYIS